MFPAADVRLESDATGIYLRRDGVDVRHRLAVQEGLAFAFLGLTGDIKEASDDLSECLGSPSSHWIDRVTERWVTYFGGTETRKFDPNLFSLLSSEEYQALSPFRRESAPASVSWMVTLACNRRCPYCFFQVTPWAAESTQSPPDATFPYADAVRMVREMGRIGVADLYFTGGEPLLRKDIPEIIAETTAARVRARVFTKFHVAPELARRLADAGVFEVMVSLDDARPNVANALAGSADYLVEAKQTLRNLIDAGVPTAVNAVATRLNRSHLSGLVEQLIDLKVPRLMISPYSLPYPLRPAAANLLPSPQPLAPLIAELAEKYGDRISIEAGTAEIPESEGSPCGSNLACQIGVRSLDLLPNGRVSRCRYMWYEPDLVVGDLKEESLMDVWNGSRLHARYAPGQELYAESACGTCGSFSRCHERGRCFVTAKMAHGKLFAPDAYCLEGN